MKRSLLVLTLLLVAAALFMEFWESPPEAFFQTKATTATAPAASVFMRDTETRQFNRQGTLEYRITTAESEQRGQRFELLKPTIISYQPDQPPWTLRADRGRITDNGDKVLLRGEVYAWQEAALGGKNELKSPELTLFTEKKFAESDKNVTLNTPDSRTTGVGLRVDLNNGLYNLQSRVESQYDAK